MNEYVIYKKSIYTIHAFIRHVKKIIGSPKTFYSKVFGRRDFFFRIYSEHSLIRISLLFHPKMYLQNTTSILNTIRCTGLKWFEHFYNSKIKCNSSYPHKIFCSIGKSKPVKIQFNIVYR